MTRKVEAKGTASERVTEYTYDANGNQLTVKVLGDANTAEALTVMEYDASGNMTSIKDPEGNITRFTAYDSMGNFLTKLDARGKAWIYTYDDTGRLKIVTDPLNNVTQYFYDEVGNKVREVDAENNETTYEYDHKNRLIKTTNALGNKTLFEYNTDGKLIKQADPEGKVVRYEYDNEGRLVKTIDGNGNEIAVQYDNASGTGCTSCSGSGGQPSRVIYPTYNKEFTYDVRGRKTKETSILNSSESYTTSFSYDSTGNLISQTDRENKITTYEYDALRRLIKMIDPLNQATEYTYDDQDSLISLKDAKGNTTRFEYDRNNRLVKEIKPMGQETRYQYDDVGNLIEKLDAKNQKTSYTYDNAGRLETVRYFNASSTLVKTVTFTYDKLGNLKGYNDGTTSAQYSYDSTYRKLSETLNLGAFELSYSYSYYKNGSKKAFTGSDSVTYNYTYDANNQLTGIQIPGQGSITYTSYKWDRPASITLPGGSTKDYLYDPLMRIKQITSKDPAQNVLMNYQYTYDKMDNIKTKGTEHGSYTYDYDDLSRLTHAESPVQNAEGYTYDPVGNRITAQGVTGNWSYNQNNELQSYNGVTFQYDQSGSTIQKNDSGTITNYIYDVENRLGRVEDGSGSAIAEYYYDPFGKRLWKEAGGTKTYFLYSEEGLIGEYDESGSQTKAYGYVPNSTWTTDPIFMRDGNNYYLYHNDHLGTPQKITTASGAVVWAATYTSFGEEIVDASSAFINNLRFPGQYYDQETGLHYNYSRYYNQTVGRYMTKDPIRLLGGLNLFTFCQNNPVNLVDPLGLFNDGGPGAPYPGHGDFTGHEYFDFTLEDKGSTQPYPVIGEPGRHFRDLSDSEFDVEEAITACNFEGFERAMHRGQDFFVHYEKGYRWDPGNKNLQCQGVGHYCVPDADNDPVAWARAEAWTQPRVERYINKCGCNLIYDTKNH